MNKLGEERATKVRGGGGKERRVDQANNDAPGGIRRARSAPCRAAGHILVSRSAIADAAVSDGLGWGQLAGPRNSQRRTSKMLIFSSASTSSGRPPPPWAMAGLDARACRIRSNHEAVPAHSSLALVSSAIIVLATSTPCWR